jgi:hypothetical protein
MPGPAFYEICVEGHIHQRWSDWFSGLSISYLPTGETILSGLVVDQAALHGVLMKIRDLRLVLISVNRIEQEKASI